MDVPEGPHGDAETVGENNAPAEPSRPERLTWKEKRSKAASARRSRLRKTTEERYLIYAHFAREAYVAGDEFFEAQIRVNIHSNPLLSETEEARSLGPAWVLARIEAEGWHLEHVGYNYVQTGDLTIESSISADGHISGIYLFRRVPG